MQQQMQNLFQGLKEDNERLAQEIRTLASENAKLKTQNDNYKSKIQESKGII